MVTDQPAPPRHQVALVACARGETQFITEWLLYHRSIGFDHVYLYGNDDDPIHLYGQVLPFLQTDPPFVSFVHFPYPGQQFYMVRHFLEHRKDAAEWIAFLDVDEFLCLPGLDDVKRYLAACPPEWDAIHFNRNDFGPGPHAERPAGSVLVNYTRRAAALSETTKNITRSARIDVARIDRRHPFWQEWGGMLLPGSVEVNVLGEPMAQFWGVTAEAAHAAFTRPDTQARIRARGLVHRYAFKSRHDLEQRIRDRATGEFEDPAIWEPHAADGGAALLERLDRVEDPYLAAYWRRTLDGAETAAVVPRPTRPNLARGKPALQSSFSEWSPGASLEQDAAGAVSGRITGGFQFHTEMEAAPWWRVDLLAPHLLTEIRVYNRLDHPDHRLRLGRFMIEGSMDAVTWQPIYVHDGSPVGGADGYPLLLHTADGGGEPVVCRHLRLTALQPTWLHLDQLEVYGEPWQASPPPPAAAADSRPAVQAALDDLIALLGRQIGAPPG